MRRACSLMTAAAVLAAAAFAAASVEARCTRLAFSVNDYGKDGPTKDAKDLLDKYIANWTKSKGIAKYTVGRKDVSCELFLNLIVVDEHTCKASALVCWGDNASAATDKKASTAK
ncbi:MAG: hypothetical protein WAN86_16050 [Hyphomicrobiaceae bacterium]